MPSSKQISSAIFTITCYTHTPTVTCINKHICPLHKHTSTVICTNTYNLPCAQQIIFMKTTFINAHCLLSSQIHIKCNLHRNTLSVIFTYAHCQLSSQKHIIYFLHIYKSPVLLINRFSSQTRNTCFINKGTSLACHYTIRIVQEMIYCYIT